MSVTLEVPFHDVDSLRVVWHGHYYKYFEVARTALFRELGFESQPEQAKKPGTSANNRSLRVVETNCRYLSPLRYGDRFAVRAWIRDVDPRICVSYDIVRDADRVKIARGRTWLVVLDEHGTLVREFSEETRRKLLAS